MRPDFVNESRIIAPVLNPDFSNDRPPSYLNRNREWHNLFKTSKDIFPYLYYKIKNNSSITDFPNELLQEVKDCYYQNLSHNMLLYEDLKAILHACKDKDIKIVLLKGAFLARFVYEDLGLRPMTDIDILIEEKDFEIFKDVLETLGYYPVPRGNFHFLKDGFFRIDIDISFDTWYLGGRVVWERLKTSFIEEVQVFHLSPEDLIIQAAAHCSIEHGNITLISLLDILKIIERYKQEINWQSLVQRIKEYNLSVPVFYVFKESKKALDAPIPGWVIDSIKPDGLKRIEAKIYKFLIDFSPTSNIDGLIEPLFQKGIIGKVKFLIRYLFPTKRYMEQRYETKGNTKLIVFYVIRPLLLFKELGRNILGLMGSAINKFFARPRLSNHKL